MTFCGGQRDALTTAELKENTDATRARPQQRLVMPRPVSYGCVDARRGPILTQ
jgi:hypothetical protein